MSIEDYGIPNYIAVGSAKSQPSNTNLAFTTNYVFSLPKVPNAIYFCTNISIPGMTCNELIYKRGRGIPLKVPGSEIIHGEISFTYLVDERLKNYTELQEWFRRMTSFNDKDAYLMQRDWMSEEGQLIVLSAKKTPKFRITFRGLFPSRLSGMSLNSADVEATNMTANVSLSFTYYNMEFFDE
jgi:hypothetical protein